MATRVGGKKANDSSSFFETAAAAAVTRFDECGGDARAEMKSSSISFESWPYDKFVLMTRHVFVSTFLHTHHPAQC